MSQPHPGTPYCLAGAELDGGPVVVLAVDGRLHRLADLMPEVAVPEHLHELLSHWDTWEGRVESAAGRADEAPPIAVTRWLAPVQPAKLICIGVNYRDHLEEMGGAAAPALPYAFLKPSSTGVVASGASVVIPTGAQMVDWEAELAVVIGRPLGPGQTGDVLDAVAGYTVYNDLSARDWISRKASDVGIDWVLMKGHDGFSPIGPFLTPARLVLDPQDLSVRCWVNGEIKQDSRTSQMIFGVREILEHLSAIMTLEPGDVVATGTPAGVGFGARPQQFLQPGDSVVVEVEGLGRLETFMVGHEQGVAS
jgi:2-keto-4-pentenoate hydratase/2-oxohepta-3-ene-1,7-dioic acid hydratase in catechol pathway